MNPLHHLLLLKIKVTLYWRHNEHDDVSNHWRLYCLLRHLIRRTSKKTSKLRVTGLCEGNHRWPVDSIRKGPLTRILFRLMTSSCHGYISVWYTYDGLVQERRNSSALAMELRFSCTNPSISGMWRTAKHWPQHVFYSSNIPGCVHSILET